MFELNAHVFMFVFAFTLRKICNEDPPSLLNPHVLIFKQFWARLLDAHATTSTPRQQ